MKPIPARQAALRDAMSKHVLSRESESSGFKIGPLEAERLAHLYKEGFNDGYHLHAIMKGQRLGRRP